jgi:hypothetical protein
MSCCLRSCRFLPYANPCLCNASFLWITGCFNTYHLDWSALSPYCDTATVTRQLHSFFFALITFSSLRILSPKASINGCVLVILFFHFNLILLCGFCGIQLRQNLWLSTNHRRYLSDCLYGRYNIE